MTRKTSARKKMNKQPETDTARILRSLTDEEAFYFYETVDRPTGDSARSLSDFLEKTKSVKLESLFFHFQRNDFKNWIENALGDAKLAKQIGDIRFVRDNRLRTRISTVVNNRLKELEETQTEVQIATHLEIPA